MSVTIQEDGFEELTYILLKYNLLEPAIRINDKKCRKWFYQGPG
jgi:hypothetical protein